MRSSAPDWRIIICAPLLVLLTTGTAIAQDDVIDLADRLVEIVDRQTLWDSDAKTRERRRLERLVSRCSVRAEIR